MEDMPAASDLMCFRWAMLRKIDGVSLSLKFEISKGRRMIRINYIFIFCYDIYTLKIYII